MVFIAGLLGLAILFSFASPAVHRFFEPPATRLGRSRSATRAWAAKPDRKRKPKPSLSTKDFWSGLDAAIRRDRSVIALLPRNEGPRPLQGWNHPWLPADELSAKWHAMSQGFQRRRPSGRALRSARRSPIGNFVSSAGPAGRKPPGVDRDA